MNVPNVNLPVVVGMHGGGFHAGLSSSLGPDLLLNQDNLIIVSNEKRNMELVVQLIEIILVSVQ